MTVRATFGGYDDSVKLNMDLFTPAAIPVVNTLSAAARLISNAALAVFNLIKAIGYTGLGIGQWAFSKERTGFDYALDSVKALGLNVLASAYSIFEAIPVVGCVPAWIGRCANVFVAIVVR